MKSRATSLFFAVGIVVLLSLAGCSTKHTTKSEKLPNLDPGNDKSTLVLLRDTMYGAPFVFKAYVDREFIGETKAKTYLVAKVDPGERYVITIAENTGVAKLNFEPGKIYFLNQNITMGWWKARTSGFTVSQPNEAMKSMNDCDYYNYDPSTKAAGLSQREYNGAVKDYEEWVERDPKSYGDILTYKGVLYSDFVGQSK